MSSVFLSPEDREKFYKELLSRSLQPFNFKSFLNYQDSVSAPTAGNSFNPLRYTFEADQDYWLSSVFLNSITIPDPASPLSFDNSPLCRTRMDISFSSETIAVTAAPTAANRNVIASLNGGLISADRNNGAGTDYVNSLAGGQVGEFIPFSPNGFLIEKGRKLYLMFYAKCDDDAVNPRHMINWTLYLTPVFR